MTTRKWRELIRKLRERYQVECPVYVIRRPIKRCCGATRFDGRVYRIYVDSGQQKQGQVDTLLHEWAHVRAIEDAYQHRGRWAEIHGDIYETWVHNFREASCTP